MQNIGMIAQAHPARSHVNAGLLGSNQLLELTTEKLLMGIAG